MILLSNFLQPLIDADTWCFLAINQCYNGFFDTFMSSYSGKWIWIPMYASIFYIILRNYSWKAALWCILGVALTITFADQVSASLIRPYVERLRPSNLQNPLSEIVHIVNGHRGGRYGFPSCHAANTFGLAFFLCFVIRNRVLTMFLIGWALLTCYSRVYLGVHYPGDLLAGTLVGFTGAFLIYRLINRLTHGAFREQHAETHVYAPALVGTLTVAGILCYSAWGILIQ